MLKKLKIIEKNYKILLKIKTLFKLKTYLSYNLKLLYNKNKN